jgi:hypothetical protein
MKHNKEDQTSAKQVANTKNMQSKTKAWPFRVSKHHQALIKAANL